jgi:hypothetical protein
MKLARITLVRDVILVEGGDDVRNELAFAGPGYSWDKETSAAPPATVVDHPP